jgi:hypothetical protein
MALKRAYCRIAAEPYDPAHDRDQAIAAGAYARKYFLEDGAVGRVDYHLPRIGLYKISYRQIEPPFELMLAEHFREHPADVYCEFVVAEGVGRDGLRIEKQYLFKSPADEELTRTFFDEKDRVVRRIFFALDGRPISEERPRYNNTGEIIGREVCDASTGERWFDADYSRDD